MEKEKEFSLDSSNEISKFLEEDSRISGEKKEQFLELKNNKTRMLGSLFSVSISRGISSFLMFLGRYIILVQWLSINEYVNFVIFFRYSEIFQTLFLLGPMVIPHFISDETAYSFKKYLEIGLSISIINIIIIALVMLIWINLLNISNEILSSFYFFVVLFFSTSSIVFMRFFDSMLVALKENKKTIILNLSYSFSFLMISYVLIKLIRITMLGSILAYMSAGFIGFLFGLFFFYKKKDNFNVKLDLFKIKENKHYYSIFIKYSYPIMLGTIAYIVTYRINTLFLQSNVSQTFYYETASSLVIFLIGFIGIPIQDSLFPYLSTIFKDMTHDSKERLKEIYRLSLFLLSTILLGTILFLFLYIELFLSYIFPDYSTELFYYTFRILLIGAFFYISNQLYSRYPVAAGNSKILLNTQIIGALINIIFVIGFVYSSNYSILLFSFIISNFIMFLIYFYSFLKYTKFSISETKILELIFSFSLVIIGYSFLQFFDFSDIITLLIKLFLFSLFYFCLWLFKILKREEIMEFVNFILKKSRI